MLDPETTICDFLAVTAQEWNQQDAHPPHRFAVGLQCTRVHGNALVRLSRGSDQTLQQRMMRVEIDPPLAHVAPLSRSLLSTAALDIVGLATAREAGPAGATSLPHTPVSVHGDTARRTLPPVSHEDLWATPTSDLADLVAQVLAQLTGVRRSS